MARAIITATGARCPIASPAHAGPQMKGGKLFTGAVQQYGRAMPAYDVHRSDADRRPRTRREAIKSSRTLRSSLGIMKALGENTARYSVGRGLSPSSMCEDTDWAKEADEIFDVLTNTKKFDVREDLTFKGMQKVILPDVMFDGDAGAAPVRLRGETQPRIQLFPADAIGDGGGASIFGYEGARWSEGILRSEVGTPIAYRILKSSPVTGGYTGNAFWDYQADHFFHIGRTDRINGNRPMPWMYHGDQSALNILDLNTLEMAAFRLNSYFAAAIRAVEGSNLKGVFDDLASTQTRTVTEEDPNSTTTPPADRARELETRLASLFGKAAIMDLEPGEEMQFYKNERDPANFKSFVDYLVTDIAVGFGVPPHFIWGLSGLTGPYVRLVLQQADWFFQDCAEMMVQDFCQPVWEGVIQDAMFRGVLRAPRAGTNWRRVHWQGPGSMTIDKGRDGKMYLDQLKNGIGRRSAWYEMIGMGGINECRRDIDEIAELIAYCDAKGVPHNYYFGKDIANSTTAPVADPGQADTEDVVEGLANELEMRGMNLRIA